jgi:predicted AlkP superfamily pyrophosphatase or phosphodiesterase
VPRVCLLNVVALTPDLLRHAPRLAALGPPQPLRSPLPAVTATSQATLLTGLSPAEHGVVANGWLYRDTGEVRFWQQSNSIVQGEKLYEGVRTAKLFWWFNQGAPVEWFATPKPHYGADGSKVFGIIDATGCALEPQLGTFPFHSFWGPRSGLAGSEWIARAAALVMRQQQPELTLVYLPHLDYDFQRYGPDDPRSQQAVADVDVLVRDLLAAAKRSGAETIVVSEYGIAAVEHPVHVNRALRKAGLLTARATPAGEVLDVFASRAFALADHQIAHVYVKDPADRSKARAVIEGLDHVDRVMEGNELESAGLAHARSGDLVALSDADAWFTYYYWLDASAEPDFAPTVDIHRKPGYDPCELFVDPALKLPALRVARRLAQKKLGMRYLMDVIPLDATLVQGSHGRIPEEPLDGPVFLCSAKWERCGGVPDYDEGDGIVEMTSVPERVLALLQRA